MATDIQKLQNAVEYCIKNNLTVTEGAKACGVDAYQLSIALSQAMNPNGPGMPEDVLQLSTKKDSGSKKKFEAYKNAENIAKSPEIANSKSASATLSFGGRTLKIVAVGLGNEGSSARLYNENNEEVSLEEFKDIAKIQSLTIDKRTGEIKIVQYDPKIERVRIEQSGNGSFIETLGHFWNTAKSTGKSIAKAFTKPHPNGNSDVVADNIINGTSNNGFAKANGAVQGAADGTAKAGAADGVKGGELQPDVKQALAQYGVDAKDYKNIEAGVKEQYDKMSDDKKAEVADAARKLDQAVEGGDPDAIQKAVAEIASLFVPDDIPGFKPNDAVFYACLAVSVVALVALAAEAGAGTALTAAVDKLATSGVGKLAMATFTAVGMASCSPEENAEIKDEGQVIVTTAINVATNIDNKALAEAYNKGIQDLMDFLKTYMEKLIKNQNNLMDFVAQILAKLDSQGVKLDNIEELIKNFMAQYGIDAKNKDELLAKIYTAITNADAATREALNGISEKIDQNNEKADETNALLTKLIGLVNKLGKDGKELGSYILQMLNKIGLSMNANFSKLLEAVERGNVSLDEIKAMLAELNKLVADGNKQNQELGEKILNYLGAIGFEMNRNFTAVLEAINKGVAGTESLRDLLEKILDNQDKNTKAIIEAIGNIKIDGGNIDLSSIEKMLAELIDLTKKNGNTLSSIDGKLDVIQLTQQAILDKINVEAHKGDERYQKTNALLNEILDKVGKQNGSYDDSKLLDILNNLSKLIDTKLDQILDAIKDHDVKVTVDVTGQVKCECNCGNGGKHEGILGDLDKILE